MDEVRDILRNNRLEDVTWLCSLTESELDLLVSLKRLVLQRAKIIGHEELAKRFDLKMLRALGFVLIEYFRGKTMDLSLAPGSFKVAAFMDGCNLLKSDIEDTISIEQLKALICSNSRKRPRQKFSEKYDLK